MEMTDDEFRLFRDLVHRECGIYLKDSKKDFLRAKVEKLLASRNMAGSFSYYKLVTSQREELRAFLDAVTINETYFFRNTPQFEMLREKVLPGLIERKRSERNYCLGVWSAGCATGEEPYSIAMEILEAIPDSILWQIKIIASDISLKCLGQASIGAYPPDKLRDVPEKYSAKYFKQARPGGEQARSEELFEVKDFVKKVVAFDYHNLMHENPISGVDIVFCRNVLIYFEPEEQKRVVERILKALKPGGYLFLGHAESLFGIANGDFRFLYWNKGTAYQKVTDGRHG